MNCDQQILTTNSKCFECIPAGHQASVQTMLLAQLAGISTDPNVLAGLSSCLRCLDGMYGAVIVYLLNLLAQGGTVATFRLLQSPDLTVWALGVLNDGSRESDVSSGPVTTIVLASPDTTHWAVTVENDGSWTTTPTGAALTDLWTGLTPNGTLFTITIENDGGITVT